MKQSFSHIYVQLAQWREILGTYWEETIARRVTPALQDLHWLVITSRREDPAQYQFNIRLKINIGC